MNKNSKEKRKITIILSVSLFFILAMFTVLIFLYEQLEGNAPDEIVYANSANADSSDIWKESAETTERQDQMLESISASDSQAFSEETAAEEITSKEEAVFEVDASGSETMEPVGATETQNSVSEPVYLNLIAVGDNLVHKQIDDTIIQPDGSYDFDQVYQNIKAELSDADIAILNQEVPAAGNNLGISGYPSFNAPTECIDSCVKLGFNVFTLATNHCLDQGKNGLNRTLGYIHETAPQVLTCGTACNEEEYNKIPVIEKNGIRVAILNYTYGTNGYKIPDNYSVHLLKNEDEIHNDILRARTCADFIIVAPHWGTEYQLSADDSQKELAKKMSEWGADLIIGTHPHVLQQVEWVTNSQGKRTLVYYSLGNFVSAQIEEHRIIGGMAKLRLKKEGNCVTIDDASLDYVVTHYYSNPGYVFASFRLFMLNQYPEAFGRAHGIVQWDTDYKYEDLLRIAQNLKTPWN